MKDITSKIITALLFVLLSGNVNAQESCHFSINESSLKLQWTAFKTSEKLAVKGEFTKFKMLAGPVEGGLNQAVRGVKFQVDKLSVSTGDPVRDATLNEFFFAKLQGDITGEIKEFSLIEGLSLVNFTMNNVSKDISAGVQMEADGSYVLYGKINLADFSASSALMSLNEKCKVLHTGKDGVSKTWDEVEFKLQGALQKNCK